MSGGLADGHCLLLWENGGQDTMPSITETLAPSGGMGPPGQWGTRECQD